MSKEILEFLGQLLTTYWAVFSIVWTLYTNVVVRRAKMNKVLQKLQQVKKPSEYYVLLVTASWTSVSIQVHSYYVKSFPIY